MPVKIQLLEEKIHYIFKDKELLKQALTHSSYINENNLSQMHNERLEFLGDAVLELTISKALYHKYPQEREGSLTQLRSKMVNEKSLAKLAKEIGLGSALLLGKGEEKQGGRTRPALLADALEALIGAVYLDKGIMQAESTILRLFENSFAKPSGSAQPKSYKTLLQEYTQGNFRFTPEYILLSDTGPEHAKVYTVQYKDHQGFSATGTGKSLKRAEHEAAKLALIHYGQL